MSEAIGAQIEVYRVRLEGLVRRGREVSDAVADDPANETALGNVRLWQQDGGVVVNELSGGSKAHWLARAFSEAFLVRNAEVVAPNEIAQRLIGVLEQALASLSQQDAPAQVSSSQAPPLPHRFDFVPDPEIRPALERAYLDGRAALEAGEYDVALRTYSGIIEAVVTAALQYKGLSALRAEEAPGNEITGWPFVTRLAVAEKSGLIGRGCARLPEVARSYREHDEAARASVTERDARVTGQVLHVIMRDLNPGR